MSGLIFEIQQSCLKDNFPVESLLRRVKLAATKLKLGTLESWVDNELNGYDGDIPVHRVLHGEPLAWNPFNGWISVQTDNSDWAVALGTVRVSQGIGGLRDLIESNDGGTYHFPIPPDIVVHLNQGMRVKTSKMVVKVPRGGIVGILDFVRNMVLDWTIEMERNGVIGDGFSFDAQEVENAKAVMTTFNIGTIGNFAGNMGTGNTAGDIALTATNIAQVRETMQKLRNAAPTLIENGADGNLPDLIDAVLNEADKQTPNVGRLKTLTQDVRAALAGAAGNLTAEGAIALVGGVLKILGGG
jgi:hypothetical protein